MAGVDGFRKMQLGAEVTAGTAVAATAIWRGKAGMPDDRRVTMFPEEDIALASGDSRTYVPLYDAGLEFPETEMTFEQPYILEAGIKAVGTGVADGAGAGKIYAYPLPTDAASLNTLRTYTIESGDNQQAEEMEYSFVESFKISGKPGEALKWSAAWRGRQWTTTTFTGALSLPTVETILASKGKLYIDAVSGTLGGTQVSASLLGMELSVKTGWRPVNTGDGYLYFTGVEFVRELMEVVLQLTFRHNASAVSEKANWRAETARKLRLQYDGSALTAGTAYSAKALRIDLAGKWEKFERISAEGGIHTSTGVFRARKDATANLFANLTVVNALTSLT
jgi:hypothetical protein